MGKYDLSFDLVDRSRQVNQLAAFMRAHRGPYNEVQHNAWLEDICIPGVNSGERRALAWWQNGRMIGDAVLKAAGPNTAELKNFRVASPQWLQGRGLGAFMLRQATVEATELLVERGLVSNEANAVTLMLDTLADSSAAAFFAYQGFREVGRAELYTPGQQEVIMELEVPLE
ncbi:MAG: hypothetical protein JWL85_269 [Candidatus Saccharibacteria bacterium]|nr:hypothetical protein [Candidatus Saccharibacteria bacterium]